MQLSPGLADTRGWLGCTAVGKPSQPVFISFFYPPVQSGCGEQQGRRGGQEGWVLQR